MDTLFKLNSLREKEMQARVCAAIVFKGRIVDVGFNSKKTHTVQKGFNELKPFLHAETEAIMRSFRKMDLNGCYLVVVRNKKDGRGGQEVFGCSKPCTSCVGIMALYGVKKAYYTDENGEINILKVNT